VGYKTLERQAGTEPLTVRMEPDETVLDEVVVVGYGTQKKSSLTGSVAQVNATEIKRAPMGNITHMITGRLPGLVLKQSGGQPGADASSMNTRGASSFASSNNPVVILDGVRRSCDQLKPEAIESSSILKDASAAA